MAGVQHLMGTGQGYRHGPKWTGSFSASALCGELPLSGMWVEAGREEIGRGTPSWGPHAPERLALLRWSGQINPWDVLSVPWWVQ